MDGAVALSSRLTQGGVIAAAVGVFSKLGFAATRVEDILDAAGIARRTFYKHFDGKEGVLTAVYELATGELLKVMRSAAVPEENPFDAIRRGLDVYLDYHVQNAALVRVLVEQAVRSDSPLFAVRKHFRSDLVRLVDDAVRASSGETNDPLLYVALISSLEGVSLELLAEGATPAAVHRAKRVMHQLLERVLPPARAARGRRSGR